MKKTARMPIRVVFYRDDDNKSVWIAHCLEFDLIGHGTDWNQAMSMLTEAVGIQIRNTLKSKNYKNLFTQAPAEYQMMFAKGKHVVNAELTIVLKIDDFEIEEINAREYDEDSVDERDLVTV